MRYYKIFWLISTILWSELASASCCSTCSPLPCRTYRDGSASGTKLTSISGASADPIGGGGGGAPATSNDSGSAGDTGGNLGSIGVTKILKNCDFCPCYEISAPGNYIFGETIILENPATCTCALTISSDDVTVDLQGYSLLYGDYGKDTMLDGISGICIAADTENVTIRNGAVRKFTGYGIKAHTGGTAEIKQLLLHDLTIQNNNIGISLVGTSSKKVKLASITNTSASCNSKNGIELTYVQTAKLLDTTASENTNTGSNLYGTAFSAAADKIAHGIRIESSDNVDMTNTDTEKNTTQTASTNAYGTRVISSEKVSLNSAVSNYNVAGTGGSSYGLSLESSTSCIIDGNRAERNSYGYYDNATNSTSIFIRNVAVTNTTANYAVTFNTGAFNNWRRHATINQLQDIDATNADGSKRGEYWNVDITNV